MPSKAAFEERDGGFFPLDDDGREMVRAARGKRLMLSAHVPRNLMHHRLLFHLLRRVCEGGAWSGDEESLLIWLKLRTHQVRAIVGPDKTHFVPDSISFESMDQLAFSKWFERAVHIICTELLGRDDWQWLRDEVAAAVDGRLPERRRAA